MNLSQVQLSAAASPSTGRQTIKQATGCEVFEKALPKEVRP